MRVLRWVGAARREGGVLRRRAAAPMKEASVAAQHAAMAADGPNKTTSNSFTLEHFLHKGNRTHPAARSDMRMRVCTKPRLPPVVGGY